VHEKARGFLRDLDGLLFLRHAGVIPHEYFANAWWEELSQVWSQCEAFADGLAQCEGRAPSAVFPYLRAFGEACREAAPSP